MSVLSICGEFRSIFRAAGFKKRHFRYLRDRGGRLGCVGFQVCCYDPDAFFANVAVIDPVFLTIYNNGVVVRNPNEWDGLWKWRVLIAAGRERWATCS